MKKNLFCTAISAIVMLLLPWCAVRFVPSDGGMMVSLLLLLIINPIAAVCIGTISGLHPKSLWYQPLLLAALFAGGAGCFLQFSAPDFLLYAAVYLALGYLAFGVTVLLRRKKS